jgi:hypothetical protein
MGCIPELATGCRTPLVPQKGLLLLKNKSDNAKDQVVWKWIKGSATAKAEFGDPVNGTTGYQLCVYDQTGGVPNLVLDATAPPGGTCNIAKPTPCWKMTKSGFKYKDKDLTPDGVLILTLKEGAASKSKVVLKGKGVNLGMPTSLAIVQPVTVQVSNTLGVCWEATYSAPATKNQPDQFKDKPD